jgi:hypothetical protein
MIAIVEFCGEFNTFLINGIYKVVLDFDAVSPRAGASVDSVEVGKVTDIGTIEF